MLGLESERAEEVYIQTFGSENTRTQTVELVTATIALKEGGSTQVLFHSFVNLYHAYQLPTLSKSTTILPILT